MIICGLFGFIASFGMTMIAVLVVWYNLKIVHWDRWILSERYSISRNKPRYD